MFKTFTHAFGTNFRWHSTSPPSPSDIRSVASDAQKTAQAIDNRHSLHGYQPAQIRLKSRRNFLKSTTVITSLEYEQHRRWILIFKRDFEINFKVRPMEELSTFHRSDLGEATDAAIQVAN